LVGVVLTFLQCGNSPAITIEETQVDSNVDDDEDREGGPYSRNGMSA
jgi:hypothetical protein